MLLNPLITDASKKKITNWDAAYRKLKLIEAAER